MIVDNPRAGRYRERQTCALCRSFALARVLSLPATPLANEYVKTPQAQDVFPLNLALCAGCGHLQLHTLVDAERIFSDYVYVSGTSQVTIDHFTTQAVHIAKRFGINTPGAFVVDIGSNDGTALEPWKTFGARVMGIDPATKIAEAARAKGIPTVNAFFTRALAEGIKSGQGAADVVLANNVFAHAEDLLGIAEGIERLLAPQGVCVGEVSYLMDMAEAPVFDVIYHEHFSYHAVKPLVAAFARVGLELFDCERIPGQRGRGSLRFYVGRPRKPLEQSVHSMSPSVAQMIADEERAGLFDVGFYARLSLRIDWLGPALRKVMVGLRAAGKTVVGFGAPAKMTTFLYALRMEKSNFFDYVVDDSEWKQGLYTPGLNIPIKPVSALLEDQPDVCFVFAWNFAESITKRLAGAYRGTVIVPLPQLITLPGG